MLNYILQHDGVYAVEDICTSVLFNVEENGYHARERYPYLNNFPHLRTEHDWLLTSGRGDLKNCHIPINKVVVNTLLQIKGDLRIIFNFSDRDCPDYITYTTQKSWVDKQARYQAQLDRINEIRQKDPQSPMESTELKAEYDKLEELRKELYPDSGRYQYRTGAEAAQGKLDAYRFFVAEDNGLYYKIDTLEDAMTVLIMYAFYKSLIRLPYDDSAVDEIPTIEGVTLNGEVTTVLDDILHYISDNMFDGIPKDSNGEYYIMIRKKKPLYKVRGGIIPSPKKLDSKYKTFYVGIGGPGNPICVGINREAYKCAYRTRSIDCVLNLYKRDELKMALQEGKDLNACGNDYIHSGTAYITDILHFAIAFPYVVSIIIGKLMQHERDVIIGYDVTFNTKRHGEIVPFKISTTYVTAASLNRIWRQLTNNYQRSYGQDYDYEYWS